MQRAPYPRCGRLQLIVAEVLSHSAAAAATLPAMRDAVLDLDIESLERGLVAMSDQGVSEKLTSCIKEIVARKKKDWASL
eukprot:SAG11_NODE_15717_length_568_cov_1.345416_1_plen_80_part_00